MRKRAGLVSRLGWRVALGAVAWVALFVIGWAWYTGTLPPEWGGGAAAAVVAVVMLVLGWSRRRVAPANAIAVAQPLRLPIREPSPEIHHLSPDAFRRAVWTLFEHDGYRVEPGPVGGPHRVDLLVSKSRLRAVVLCRLVGPDGVVERHVVRELYEAMLYEEARRGYLLTDGAFSAPAVEWARHKKIELIDGAELASRLQQSQPHNVSS